MIESLIIAGLTGLVIGALMLGVIRGEVKGLRAAVNTMHARFDGFVLAMMQHGAIEPGALEHLARQTDEQREARFERRQQSR